MASSLSASLAGMSREDFRSVFGLFTKLAINVDNLSIPRDFFFLKAHLTEIHQILKIRKYSCRLAEVLKKLEILCEVD